MADEHIYTKNGIVQNDIIGAVVECVPLAGGKPVYVEVESVDGDIGFGYRVRRSDLTRSYKGFVQRRGPVAQAAHRSIVVAFGRWSVMQVVREARRG